MIGDRQTIRIAKDDTPEQLFRSVVFALDAEARSWGKPPDSFYWVPHIQFIVSPGGNQHFARLNRDLQKLGLQTEVSYRLESTAPTQREASDGP